MAFAEKIGKLNLNIISRIRNYSDYRAKRISKFEYLLRRDYLRSPYSAGDFYQSYPPLYIKGMRPSLSRFRLYELASFLNKKTTLLDIGANTGFFSAYISRFVKHIDIVEIDKPFTKICQRLLRHEKIKNVTIFNTSFEEFQPKKKYDFILSLAVHQYMTYDLDEYFEELNKLLNKKGKVLFETHDREWERKGRKNILERIEKQKHFKVIKQDLIDDNDGRIRKFFILEKK